MRPSGQSATLSLVRNPYQQTQGECHVPHRIQICNRDHRVHAPGVQRPARGFLGAIERQETQTFPTIRDHVRHGPDQSARPDLRSGRQALLAEAGTGGLLTPAGRPGCPIDVNVFSPYTAGFSGRVIRVQTRWHKGDGGRQSSEHDRLHRRQLRPDRSSPSSASTLYVLIEMGGCSHAMPDDLPAILRVNRDGSTTNVANLNQWHATNPPHFIKDIDPATTDQEPGGVFHSMIAIGKYLYVVETNRGFLLRVDPRTGAIETLYDMTIDDREHNPIVMTQRGKNFFVGTFGEDGGKSELAVFDSTFPRTRCRSSRAATRSSAWRGTATTSMASRSSPTTINGRPTPPTSSGSIAGPVSG